MKKLWVKYYMLRDEIRTLQKEQSVLLEQIQDICPHENVDENGDYYEEYLKCNDCGEILNSKPIRP